MVLQWGFGRFTYQMDAWDWSLTNSVGLSMGLQLNKLVIVTRNHQIFFTEVTFCFQSSFFSYLVSKWQRTRKWHGMPEMCGFTESGSQQKHHIWSLKEKHLDWNLKMDGFFFFLHMDTFTWSIDLSAALYSMQNTCHTTWSDRVPRLFVWLENKNLKVCSFEFFLMGMGFPDRFHGKLRSSGNILWGRRRTTKSRESVTPKTV